MTQWREIHDAGDVGAIGLGILAKSRVTLDFVDDTLTVDPSSEVDASGIDLHLRDLGDSTPAITISVQGQPAQALLDTGFGVVGPFSLAEQRVGPRCTMHVDLAPSMFDALFADEPLRTLEGSIYAFGSTDTHQIAYCPQVELAFGQRVFRDLIAKRRPFLDTYVNPAVGSQLDAIVGMSILSEAKTLTIDFPRCKAWIEWRPSLGGAPGELE